MNTLEESAKHLNEVHVMHQSFRDANVLKWPQNASDLECHSKISDELCNIVENYILIIVPTLCIIFNHSLIQRVSVSQELESGDKPINWWGSYKPIYLIMRCEQQLH